MKKNHLIAYIVFAFGAGIAFAVWRTVLLYRWFDPYLGEYAEDAARSLKGLGFAIFGVAVLLFTSYLLTRKTAFAPYSPSGNQLSVVASAFLGSVFLAVALLDLLYYAKDLGFGSGIRAFDRVTLLLSFLCLIPSAAYFIASASVERAGKRSCKILSFFPALWALFYAVSSYANPNYQYQDANRILCNVSLWAILLFFLFETRNTVSEPLTALRFPIALIALMCSIAYVIPLLITTAFWEVDFCEETLFEAIECGAILYLIATLRSIVLAQKAPSEA